LIEFFDLIPDIPNWGSAIIEVGIGILIGIVFHKIQSKASSVERNLLAKIGGMTERIDSFTEHKKTLEQDKKTFECKRIIEILDKIKEKEEELRESMKNYHIGDNSLLRFSVSENLGPYVTDGRIKEIRDACRELGGYVSDNSLLLNIRKYTDAFMAPSDVILNSDMPQNQQHIEAILSLLDRQLNHIQEFLTGLQKELQATI